MKITETMTDAEREARELLPCLQLADAKGCWGSWTCSNCRQRPAITAALAKLRARVRELEAAEIAELKGKVIW